MANVRIPAACKVLSLTVPLPDMRLHGLPELGDDWFYWTHPEREHALIGLGSALEIEARGESRFRTLREWATRHKVTWRHLDVEHSGTPPRLFCTYAFEADDPMNGRWRGVPNSLLCLPELMLERQGHRYRMTLSARTQGGSARTIETRWRALMDRLVTALAQGPSRAGRRTPLIRTLQQPSAEEWLDLVRRSIGEIRKGRLEKVVPARCIEVEAARRLDPSRLMAVLDCLYPTARLFGMGRGGKNVVAATPERQIRLCGDEATCDAIGGTVRRAAGEDEDRALGKRLLHSPKMRQEHAFVVDGIGHRLAQCAMDIRIPPAPRLLPLRNLQHLWTEIHARVPSGTHILDLAERLHPTPAVNGTPAQAALEWLRKEEPLQRGWFSGAGGWIDAEGNGELAVLLRCALLEGKSALLYAGAGVVDGSDPEDELAETELKFTTLLEALENA